MKVTENRENRFYGFGDFKVDARRRILSKNGENISLSPRNFDLLLILIENEGEILSHDDLLDTVWEGTFVEQANLKNAISVLRKTLGEAPNEAAYIRTVPRRGYSFVASVTILDESESTSNFPETAAVISAPEPPPQIAEPKGQIAELAAPKNPSPWKFRLVLAAIVIALLAAGGFGIRSYLLAKDRYLFEPGNLTITKLTTEGNLIGGSAAISPDGKFLVYIVRSADNVSLWTRQTTTKVSRQISPEMKGQIWACVLTPDEDFIYYTLNSEDPDKSGIYKLSTFGGSAQRVSNTIGGAMSISPDGKRIAIATALPGGVTAVQTMAPDGGDLKTVWSGTGDLRIWNMKYAVDGKGITISLRTQLPDKAVYRVLEIPPDGGSESVVIPDQEKQIADGIWAPDRKSMLLSVREINAELRQIYQYIVATGEWKRVTNDNSSYRGLTLTVDGKNLVASQETRQSTLWSSPTGQAGDMVQTLPGTHYLVDVSWTSDERIVYSSIENSKEVVGMINADGTGNRFLTSGEDGIWMFPETARDGRHITFSSSRTGRRQFWMMDYDGRNPTQISQFDTDMYDGVLLADGVTAIMLQTVKPGKVAIVQKSADGTLRTLSDEGARLWQLSPDEKSLALLIENDQSHRSEIKIVSVETGEALGRPFEARPFRLFRWTPDGKNIAYDQIESGGGKIILQPIDGSAAKTFLNLPSEEVFGFNWSSGGRRFAVTRGKHLTDAVQFTINSN